MPRNCAPDELVSILFALNVRAGLTDAEAISSARDAVRILGERWGGSRIYWPATDTALARAERDAHIRRLAASLPLADVAERVGLSVARVSQICTGAEIKPFGLPTEADAPASPTIPAEELHP